MKFSLLTCVSLAFVLAGRLAAATFTADFNSGTAPSGSTLAGNATVTDTGGVSNSGVLRLTENIGGQFSAWIVSDFSGGSAVNAFTATLKLEMGPVAGADAAICAVPFEQPLEFLSRAVRHQRRIYLRHKHRAVHQPVLPVVVLTGTIRRQNQPGIAWLESPLATARQRKKFFLN